MMKMRNMCYRFQQWSFSKLQNFLPWHMPEVISGVGSIRKIPEQIKKEGTKKILIVTTPGSVKRGTLNGLFDELKKEKIPYTIYDNVHPDPTIECIEDTVKFYNNENCKAIIAVGGGSVIDCAKVVGARVVRPEKSISQMAGVLKIRKKLPSLYAVPTTAGTGSETTVAAVVTDSSNHHKYAISDLCLMPKYAVLDPELTLGLPRKLTSITGMDALTHAVEAYTNKYTSKESKKYALKAVKLIFENLKKVYDNGNDIKARDNMLKASFYAGAAFTRSYVGYVHAIAHAVGGLYGIPHGLANSVILPVVLEAYGKSIYKELAELADAAGIHGKTDEEKSQKVILSIKHMNQYMDIPDKLNDIKKEDIPKIINWAIKEANPSYPVPVIWDKEKFEEVIKSIS